MGLGFLLIQPVVNLRQGRKTEAAELFVEGTLCSTVSNSITTKCHLQQALLGILTQTQMFSISAAFQLQSESTGREAVADESFLQLSVSEGLSPQQCPLSAIPCALFSPQDHADSGLSHGPEELPHGRADVHHAVRKL